MITAALDTSGRMASFAVRNADNLAIQLTGVVLGRKSAALFPALKAALEQAGMTWNAIQTWTVGMGPGSFTGIRIGAAFVQGICAGTGASCIGIPSSLALARAGAADDDQTVAVLNDGRRGEMIISRYGKTQTDWQVLDAPRPLPLTTVAELTDDRLIISATDRAVDQLPNAIAGRLVKLPGVNAVDLLDPSPLADPDMNPVYVRPAVFVAPSLPKPAKTSG